HMQGVPFLGEQAGKEREAVYGIRDRMDERTDFTRAVRDKRYKYVRNYLPHLPWAQPLAYMDEMPTMQEYRRLAAAGKLSESAGLFMRPRKPAEELYNLQTDPYELTNLADSNDPKHRAALAVMRTRHRDWLVGTRDTSFLPEPEMRARAEKSSVYA